MKWFVHVTVVVKNIFGVNSGFGEDTWDPDAFEARGSDVVKVGEVSGVAPTTFGGDGVEGIAEIPAWVCSGHPVVGGQFAEAASAGCGEGRGSDAEEERCGICELAHCK